MDSYTPSRDPRRAKRPRSDTSDFSSNRRVSPPPLPPSNKTTVKVDGSPSAKVAPAPFNQPWADVILRTIDFVDFRVKSAILTEASGHFRRWFDDSSPTVRPKSNERTSDSSDLPVIHLVDHSELLNILLRFCYPVEEPTIKSPSTLCDALAAALRYEMDYAAKKLFKVFDSLAEADPLEMYMLACRNKWSRCIASAAKATLGRSIQYPELARLEKVSENRFISGLELLRLQAYHRACGQAASSVIGLVCTYAADATTGQLKLSWLSPGEWAWFHCKHANSASTTEKVIVQNGIELNAAKWWTDYLRKAQEKLKSKPNGATVRDMRPFAAFAAAATDHCGVCKRQVIEELHLFNNLLALQVEQAVSEVEFDAKPETRPPGSALATTPW